MRVVIAEDSPLVRAGIVSILHGAGIDVVAEATCAEDLLREVDEHRPDVAIVDIRMPRTSATKVSAPRTRCARGIPGSAS